MNRPGHGPSDFRRGRTFLDWPVAVAAVADILGIDRFAVLGASGGASCALTLGSRVTRVGIVVGAAPVETAGMRSTPTMTAWSAKRLARRVQFEVGATVLWWGGEERFMEQKMSTLGEPDRRAMERPEVRARFLGVAREASQRAAGLPRTRQPSTDPIGDSTWTTSRREPCCGKAARTAGCPPRRGGGWPIGSPDPSSRRRRSTDTSHGRRATRRRPSSRHRPGSEATGRSSLPSYPAARAASQSIATELGSPAFTLPGTLEPG